MAVSADEPHTLAEISGFCSGNLPAVIAAVSPSPRSENFQRYAVEGFRLAFWTGLRSALFCQKVAGEGWNDRPWSLVLVGLAATEVEDFVAVQNAETHYKIPLRVSAILTEKIISLSGEGSALDHFKLNILPATVTSRCANVNGYYHGGKSLEGVLDEIMGDCQRRELCFPAWDALHVPVRSSVSGQYLEQTATGISLLESTLRHILIHSVDWRMTSDSLLASVTNHLERDPGTNYRIVALGPNSRSLLQAMKGANHPRLTVTDRVSERRPKPSPDDIAIVGMSVNYPSGKGPAQLWENLEKGLSAVQEIPSSRFEIEDYYMSGSNAKPRTRTMEARHGNFLDNPFEFDNTFFQISPREAKSIDPQQRVLLHGALEALEDAGYAPNATSTFKTESFGVYVGVATGDYVDNSRNEIDLYYSPGTLRAFLSGRISYVFQFEGPSVVVDTACSSSLVALYQACRALQAGDCASALAGGVNVISSPDMYLGLSRAHFLSSTGQCKPFDSSADGYCRGEGCGLFVLKRLADAKAEGDRIYGVIRGIEINNSGLAKSITHPDPTTQAKLFKNLFAKSKVDPDSISTVEAHGTGTQAGDYAEVQSVQSAFGRARAANNPLFLSSIKGNIGHSEAASGAAGLAKVLLMMQKKHILPQSSFWTLNPRLTSIAEHNIVVPTNMRKWTRVTGAPRRALLNNFGAAGSNAALILEEYASSPKRLEEHNRSNHLLNISAKTAGALQQLRQSYCGFIEACGGAVSLQDLCYSANSRREHYHAYRISAAGGSLREIHKKLQEAEIPERFPINKEKLTVFVFSGQGSFYQGMGAELMSTVPAFRDTVWTCADVLSGMGFADVESLLAEKGPQSGTSDPKGHEVASQCACFVLEYALAKLWMSWGIIPDLLVGHSLGEYAALAVSGALSLHDALSLVSRRAQLMTAFCDEGVSGMVACNSPPSAAAKFISQGGEDLAGLTIACKNSPNDCVVSGPRSALQLFVRLCKPSGIKVKQLNVSYGFHSSAMDPILESLLEAASSIKISTPNVAVMSSYLGRLLDADDLHPEYFINQTRQPVEFQHAVEAISNLGNGKTMAFIEVGPGSTTIPMVHAILRSSDAIFLSSLRRNEQSWVSIISALRMLYLARYPVQWREVYSNVGARFVDNIPHYPLSTPTFVLPYQESVRSIERKTAVEPPRISSPYEFLNGARAVPSENARTFETGISAVADFIKGHRVGGAPLCPASVYVELALEALKQEKPNLQVHYEVLTDITFEKPLVYDEGNELSIHTTIDTTRGNFQVQSDSQDLHCSGTSIAVPAGDIEKTFARRAAYVNRQRQAMTFADTISSRMLYEVIFPRIVSYSGPFLTIKHLSIASSGLEGHGTFQLSSARCESFVCHPAFTDTLLHAAGFIANSKINSEEACICVKLERVTVPCNNPTLGQLEMNVYCSLIECDEYIIADAYALDTSGKVIASAEGMHFKKLRLKSFQAHLSRSLKPKRGVQKREFDAASMGREPHVNASGHHEMNPSSWPLKPKEEPRILRVRDDIHATLQTKVADLCGISGQINFSASLSEMGIDSLLFIELTQELQRQFPQTRINMLALDSCSTLFDIEEAMASATDGTNTRAPTPDLVHGDSGVCTPSSGKSAQIPTPASPNPSVEDFGAFIQDVCGFSIAEVDIDCTLDSLGVDSLLSIELVHGFRQNFGVNIEEGHSVVSELTVRKLQSMLGVVAPHDVASKKSAPHEPFVGATAVAPMITVTEFLTNGSAPVLAIKGKDTFPATIQKLDNTTTALHLFHDGSGLYNAYSRIHSLDRNVYGFFSLDFSDIDSSIQTLEQLATLYIAKANLTKSHDVILGGWSFGGVLAFEVSRQLRRTHGIRSKGVILIDAPYPVGHEPLPDAVVSHICGQLSARVPKVRACIEAQFRRHARLLRDYDPQPDLRGADVPCVMLKCAELFDTQRLCGVRYAWLSDETARRDAIVGWETLVGRRMPVLEVKGSHFDLFSADNIGDVSAQLRKACEMMDT